MGQELKSDLDHGPESKISINYDCLLESYLRDTYRASGDPEQAKIHFDNALSLLFTNKTIPLTNGLAYEFITIYKTQIGEFDFALQTGDICAAAYAQTGMPDKVMRANALMGKAGLEVGTSILSDDGLKLDNHRLEDAKNYLETAVRSYQHVVDNTSDASEPHIVSIRADAMHGIGNSYLSLAQVSKAQSKDPGCKDDSKSHYYQAISLFDDTIDVLSQGNESDKLYRESVKSVVNVKKAFAYMMLDEQEACLNAYMDFRKAQDSGFVTSNAMIGEERFLEPVQKYLLSHHLISSDSVNNPVNHINKE